MFVGVLKAIKGVKIEVEQKKSFLPDIHRVNMGLRGLGCGQYKRTTFKGFLCIFLKILAKDMGKPLVPAVPIHLGHLGHPNAAAMAPIHRGLQDYVQGVEMVGGVTRSGTRRLTPIEIASAGPEEHFQRAP